MFGFAKQITKVISIFPYALFFKKSEIFKKKLLIFLSAGAIVAPRKRNQYPLQVLLIAPTLYLR